MLGQCGWSLTIQCEKQARAPPKRKGGARCKGYLTQANHSIRLDDRAKEMAREKTGIATDRMLIAATHTHSAPAAMGALGCPADPAYVALLPDRIAEAIARAAANPAPARLGWATIDDDRLIPPQATRLQPLPTLRVWARQAGFSRRALARSVKPPMRHK